MKKIVYYTLLGGMIIFSPSKLFSDVPDILVGARGSAMVLIFSFHYDIYAGINFHHSPQYEMKIAYGESYFADVACDEWHGKFWYLDGGVRWKTKEKYSDFFKTFVKYYNKIGIFYIINEKYYKFTSTGNKPFRLGGYYNISAEIKNFCFYIYYSIGGASMLGLGYGITYYIH